MILETQRLTLTPLVVEDAPDVYPLMSDPEVLARWEGEAIDDPDEVAAFVAGQVADMDDGKALYWAMRFTETGGFVGACELSDIDMPHHRAEIIVTVSRRQWGEGYADEAARALVAHAASVGFRRLVARVHFGDLRTEKLLLGLGFQEEGYLKGQVDEDGQRRDGRLFAVAL
jgi:ribosomal-protein-alanine N-acetyltransferase